MVDKKLIPTIEQHLDVKIENEKQRVSITLNTQQISHLPMAALKIEY